MPLTGRCQCGAVTYAIQGEALRVYVCHCRECRRQSASAFGISVIVRVEDFRVDEARIRTWSRPTDSGHVLDCAFCPTCGTRLWHRRSGAPHLSVKGGSLDAAVDLTGATHIWVSRKLPGVIVPEGAPQFPFEPP